MKQKRSVQGVLIIAGLADRCSNIGGACHFGTLTIPWDKEQFRKSIRQNIKADQTAKRIEEIHRPEETRTVGLRCWICRHPLSKPLEILNRQGKKASDQIWKEAQDLADHIAETEKPLEFPWPEDRSENDPETLAELEKALLLQL